MRSELGAALGSHELLIVRDLDLSSLLLQRLHLRSRHIQSSESTQVTCEYMII